VHISDGILSTPVLAGGWVVAAGLTAACLRKVQLEEIPKISVLTAVFFVADLVHVPAGPTSVHLILNGLMGIVLGVRAFPAVLLGVSLQTILLGHGGVTVIGQNAVNLGGGSLVAFGIWQLRHLVRFKRREVVFGALAGACGVFASGMLMATALLLTGREFLVQAKLVVAAHSVIMVLEAIVAGTCAGFLAKVKPEALAGHRTPNRGAAAAAGPAIVAVIIGAALLAPHPALAHKLLLDYTAVKEGLLVEAFFPDGNPARNTTMRLMTPDGKVLRQGMTNEHGGYLFPVPERADYVADADAQMGHYAKVAIPASALAGVTLSETATVDAATIEQTVSKVKAEAFPLKRVAIGFGVLAVLGGAALLASRRKRHHALDPHTH
jgi:cobalt/nickel transport system permease protein